MGEITSGRDPNMLTRAVVTLSQHIGLFSLSHGGLALATSISSTFNFLALLLILHRRLGQFPWGEFAVSFLRNLFNALLMALPLLFIARRFDWVGAEKNLLTHGAVLMLLLGLGISLYLALSFLLRSPELQVVRESRGWIKR